MSIRRATDGPSHCEVCGRSVKPNEDRCWRHREDPAVEAATAAPGEKRTTKRGSKRGA